MKTPQTDDIARGNHVVPTEWAQQLERERDEAREVLSSISLYLSVGMGEETTTAQQYEQRILDGIKMITEPIAKLWKQAEKERDEARDKAERYRLEANAMMMQRDEAREALERIYQASMVARSIEEDFAEWEKAIEMLLDLIKK